MKYFGIFSNSGDVQTALNESALTKPYVALVSGVLDYNTVEYGPVFTGPYIEDSLGNIYNSGEYGSDGYEFSFQKRADATWTLYDENGDVVTASTFYMEYLVTCEDDPGEEAQVDYHEDYSRPVEDIDDGTEDFDSSTTVSVEVDYDDEDGSVSVAMRAESCGLYWDVRAGECEDNGGCWDYENHECLDDSTQAGCECQGKYWYDDSCHDEPEPGPSESEEENPCDDWEGNGYSSYEDCTCQNYGENCEDPNPSESEE